MSSIGTSDNVHPDTLNLGAVKGHRLSDDNTAGRTDSTEFSRKQQPVSPKSFRFMLPLSTSHARGRRTKDVFGRLSSSQKHDQSHRTESALDGASHSERTGGSSDDSPTHHSAANSPHISSRTAAIHARTLAAAEAESARKAAPQSNAEPEASAVNSHFSTGGGSMTLSAADSIDIPDGGIQVLLPDRPDDQGYRGRKSVSSSSVSPASPASPSSIHGIEQVGLSEHWMIDYSAITLGKTIGHSSFGMVNEGRLNGTKVAIKTIKRDEAKGPGNDIEAFKKEAELNCKLRHPNVVLFMGICVQPKEVCIVTELMARGNVHDLLVAPIKGKSVKLRWGLRLQWAIDTAQGMAYLHSLHPVMIHRDLKTTNLLVDRGMNVKICDFGLSRFQAEDKIMTAVGTVQFAAPEVLRHEKYTEKADLFSFGTVLWELYTRKTIFDGLPQILVYKSVVEGDMPKVDKGCDPRYSQLIRDCWQLDASKRPSFRDCLDRLTPLAEELSENEYQQ
jgi:Protein tyrosine and serine/threonine kinase